MQFDVEKKKTKNKLTEKTFLDAVEKLLFKERKNIFQDRENCFILSFFVRNGCKFLKDCE